MVGRFLSLFRWRKGTFTRAYGVTTFGGIGYKQWRRNCISFRLLKGGKEIALLSTECLNNVLVSLLLSADSYGEIMIISLGEKCSIQKYYTKKYIIQYLQSTLDILTSLCFA